MKRFIKLIALTKYSRMGPSSRQRFFQFLPYLKAQGIEIQIMPMTGDEYLRQLFSTGRRPLISLFRSYVQRSRILSKSDRYDLIWIEKELFPWIPFIEEYLLFVIKKPYVVDYDDAVFHLYDQHKNPIVRMCFKHKIAAIMRHARMVTVGNTYLFEYAQRAGARRITTLPTVVDMQRYKMIPRPRHQFTVGWIGTPITQKFLENIYQALKIVSKEDHMRIVLIGASQSALQGIEREVISWSEKTEVEAINQFDVGIMPLSNDPFSKGKCGYKLIQCMACGVPVVASPVGSNNTIIDHGINGFLAETESDWIRFLKMLKNNQSMREKMGQNARAKINADFSVANIAPIFSKILFDALA